MHYNHLEDQITLFNSKSSYCVVDFQAIMHYRALKCTLVNVCFEPDMFSDFSSETKAKLMNENYQRILDLCKEYTISSKYIEETKIEMIKHKQLYHISYKPVTFDTIFICTSLVYSNIECEGAKFAIQVYKDFEKIWNFSLLQFIVSFNKLKWSTWLINQSLKIFYKHKIIKKKINMAKYPEIVHMLFPGQFVAAYNENIEFYDIARFCVSFKFINEFHYFDEYCDKKIVNVLNEFMPQVFFSNIITPELLSTLKKKFKIK
ncbi:hypothetical protein COBT_002939 [Conglomerata obtusa]